MQTWETILAVLSLSILGLIVVYRIFWGGKLFFAWMDGNEEKVDHAAERSGGRAVFVLLSILVILALLLGIVVEFR